MSKRNVRKHRVYCKYWITLFTAIGIGLSAYTIKNDASEITATTPEVVVRDVETVRVQNRCFDTITMDQYDRMVDFVYKYAGNEDFAIQHALSECILNDIEYSGNQYNIDTYLDNLYKMYQCSLSQSEFSDESEDKKDAIREAVQGALDERSMPSDVTRFEKYDESNKLFNKHDSYNPAYLSDSLLKFYYENRFVDYE